MIGLDRIFEMAILFQKFNEFRRIHGVRFFVDIDKHRYGAAETDGFGRGNERVGHGDHLVSRAHTHCQQRQPEGLGAAAHADAVVTSTEFGELLFKRLDKGSACKGAGVQHLLDGGGNFRFDGFVLGF